jgi:hypothetical protein
MLTLREREREREYFISLMKSYNKKYVQQNINNVELTYVCYVNYYCKYFKLNNNIHLNNILIKKDIIKLTWCNII